LLSTPGLQLVCDELGKSGGIGVSEHRETLLDVQTACRIAVEILNDLLCFDKLESGILELHKHEVPVNSFISDCVNMFGSQAREAGVTLSNFSLIKSEQNMMTPGVSNGWLDTDTVLMDKSKMDQVLRNLISNALKFTPRGGRVSVCASFVPNRMMNNGFLSPRDKSISGREATPAKGVIPAWLQVLRLLKKRTRVANLSIDIESGSESKFDPYPEFRGKNDQEKKYNTCHAHSGSVHGIDDTQNKSTCDKHVTSGRLRIVVTDTGAGISQENQSRLFKEIVQFNPEVLQAGGGSGLGLYITSSIVQMHGGTIRAYSAGAGSGSTFTVEIDMQLRRSQSTSSLRSKTPFDITINPGLRSPSSRRQPTRSYKEDQHHLEDFSITTTPNLKAPRTQLPRSMPSPQQSATHHPTSGHRSPPRLTSQPVAPRNVLDGQAWCDLRELHAPQPLSLVIDCSSANDYPTSPSTLAPTEDINQLRGAAGEEVYDILVVDDSSLNRKMLCRLLRTAGYKCEEANDGQSAVEKVKARMEGGTGTGSKGYYDAILMDFVMPIMDGPTATQAIRGLGYSYPIFGVTGNALDSDINYFVKCGANAVLIKPFDFDLFKKLIVGDMEQ
jgi:signal transduction histidine kinase/ActR/RegA family two-component response regulator